MPRLLGLFFLVFLLLMSTNSSYCQESKPLKDPIVIELVHLDYADAEYLASVLSPLLSEEGRVVAYYPTNSLIIKDRKSVVNELLKIIKGNSDP